MAVFPAEVGIRRVARILSGSLNTVVLALADILALSVGCWLAFHLAEALSSGLSGEAFVPWGKAFSDRVPIAIPVFLGIAAWLQGRGRYSLRQPFWDETRDLLLACALGLVVEGFVQYAFKEHVSRLWIATTWALLPALAIILRGWMKRSLSVLGVRDVPVLIVGDGEDVMDAIRDEPSVGWRVVGNVSSFEPGDVLGEARRIAARHVIVVGSPGPVVSDLLRALSTGRVSYALCLPVAGSGLSSMRSTAMVGRDFVLLTERPGLGAPLARMIKRTCDVVLASIALVAASPFALAVGILVTLDGGRPIYGHPRIGRGGREFRCLKFRSMAIDADLRLQAMLDSDPEARAEWLVNRKLRNDPRVTRIGGFIRTTGLDEIPQLWNILKGDMSFVGPRPVTRDEMHLYGADAGAYLDVRPGLTGLWQASGRSDVSYARRVVMDAWYVRNWSPWLDLVILMKTVPAVLARRGAY